MAQIMALGEDAEEGKMRLAMLVLVESIFLLPYSDTKYKFREKIFEDSETQYQRLSLGKRFFQLTDTVCKSY